MKPSEIVQAQVEAYNKRNLADFLKFYHEDIRIFDLSDPRPKREGHQGLREVYSGLFASSSLNCKIMNRIESGEFVIDDEFVTGIERFPDGLRISAVYQVKDSLIKNVWFTR